MKIYINAKSKADINRRLKQGENIIGTEYNAFNPDGYMVEHELNICESGTIVAVFNQYSSGNPIAKAWGTWNQEKNKLS